MYWESKDGNIPKHIQLCIDSVYKHKGNLEINFLNQHNISDYLPNLRPEWHNLERPAHKADYIRTRLIYKYGGLWLDCDMVSLSDLTILFSIFPPNYDYACQNMNTSIGCFMARPGCQLLKKIIDAQDSELDNTNLDFQWNGIGNELLAIHGKDYPYFRWKEWTLDEIAGGKISNLFSVNEEFETNVDKNAIIFHLCNENISPLLKIKLKESRLLLSNMLISKIFRRAFGLGDKNKFTFNVFFIDFLLDYNFYQYIKKNIQYYFLKSE